MKKIIPASKVATTEKHSPQREITAANFWAEMSRYARAHPNSLVTFCWRDEDGTREQRARDAWLTYLDDREFLSTLWFWRSMLDAEKKITAPCESPLEFDPAFAAKRGSEFAPRAWRNRTYRVRPSADRGAQHLVTRNLARLLGSLRRDAKPDRHAQRREAQAALDRMRVDEPRPVTLSDELKRQLGGSE